MSDSCDEFPNNGGIGPIIVYNALCAVFFVRPIYPCFTRLYFIIIQSTSEIYGKAWHGTRALGQVYADTPVYSYLNTFQGP